MDKRLNQLPIDCVALHQADFLGRREAEALYAEIVTGFDVCNKLIRMMDGSEFLSETGAYMFMDPELASYDRMPAVWGKRSSWTTSLARARDRIEAMTGVRFQVARCVYYKDGSEAMGFHRDLPAYGPTSAIASLSLGAEREFVLRKISTPSDRFSIRLTAGSLLFMGEGCQERYEHGLPRSKGCREPRLNITFRQYGWSALEGG